MKKQNRTFETHCLGCKVNQAEAAWLEAELARRDWSVAGPGKAAGLVVLLTCAVTGTASRQSRQMARRIAREHPGTRVVVTGCDAQVSGQAYVKQGLEVLPRAELSRLPELAETERTAAPAGIMPSPESGPWCPGLRGPGPERTRGLLKVQDGCDANCAYCIVPQARGKPRSLPLEMARQALAALASQGAAEVVLTGVHLGRYGLDMRPASSLVELLQALLEAHPLPRLRLSSLEVSEVDQALLALLASQPRVCPHLHLPLQSGSDNLLKAMGRPYTAADYARVVEMAREALPGLCLGADVMVGLPGESQADFQATHDLIASLPLSYLHVFPYSRRPGTPAAEMPGQVPGPLAKERAAQMRGLGQSKRQAFMQSQVGSQRWAVVESSGLGRTDNYCPVSLPAGLAKGSLLLVHLEEVIGSGAGMVLRGSLR